MKILVVDDMTSMRHVLIHMLRSLGFTDNEEASDGLHALNLLRKNKYDLVITDLHMPKLDGKGLLNEIRNHKSLKAMPVLMVSCEDEKSTIEEVIASQVNGFIVKPFNTKTLARQMDWICQES